MWRRQETDTLESIKRDIKRIRRAGFSAEVLGWLLLFVGAAVVWLADTKLLVIIIVALGGVLGLFFVYTGKYLKDGRGRRVKRALLLNGIVALPLSLGLIPLYVCVQSFNNYSRFKELPSNILALYSKPKPFRVSWWEVVLLVIALGVGTTSLIAKLHGITKTAKKTSTVTTSVAPQVDTAATAKFTINFPGPVSATDFTKQISGQSVPYTTYDSNGDKGVADYDVYFFTYPVPFFNYSTMPQTALTAALHTALLSEVQSLNGTVTNDTPSSFVGHPAEDAAFTSQTLGGTTNGYIRVLFIGNYEYDIFTLKASQSEFNSFANSFQYKGS